MLNATALTRAAALRIMDRGVCLWDGRKCEVIDIAHDGALIIDTSNDPDAQDCFLVKLDEISEAL